MKSISLLLLVFLFPFPSEKPVKIKPEKNINLKMHEPSDVCTAPGNTNLFMVSDDGFLYETDAAGTIIRKAAEPQGLDYEAVFADNDNVYVMEEMLRKVRIFDRKSLTITRTINVPYSGGRNKGFESITYNKTKNCYVMITESDPVYIMEFDKDFRQLNEIRFKAAKDISSACFNDGKLWLLSDEDMTIFQLNPENYAIEQSFKIPVLNPEGICFNNIGEMLVLSDDLEKLYFFKTPGK